MIRRVLLLAGATAIGCQPPPATTRPAHPPPRASAAPTAAPRPAIPYAPPPQLSLAVTRDGPMALHGVGDRLIVTGDIAFAVAEDDGVVRRSPALAKGLPMGPSEGAMPWIVDVGGHWPDATWLELGVLGTNGATAPLPQVYRFTPDGWTIAKARVEPTAGAPADRGYHYADFSGWTPGRVLGLAVCDDPSPDQEASAADFRAARPRLDVLAGDAAPRPPDLDPSLCPDRLLALPSGEIFVLGQGCGTGPIRVQRWESATSAPRVEAIPAPSCATGGHYVRSLDARRPDDVWLAIEGDCAGGAASYLAHFDARGWSNVTTPSSAVVLAISATPEGVLWAVADDDRGGLWRRWTDGRWEAVVLPHIEANHPDEVLSAKDVWAKSAFDVWAVAGRYEQGHHVGSVVLHSAIPKEVARLPSDAEIRWEAADVSPPAPGGACDRPFLTIAPLPPGAAPDFEYAELRAAMRGEDTAGIQFREVMWRGARWIGATAPSAKIAALRAHLAQKLFGTRPEPYCGFYPKVLRAFGIDAESGELEPE